MAPGATELQGSMVALNCFISRLVKFVGLEPFMGHSKLNYLFDCFWMQFFDI
jgi:hypothetical protein